MQDQSNVLPNKISTILKAVSCNEILFQCYSNSHEDIKHLQLTYI